ncbi:MAG: hypothetical protein ACK5LN_14340 [Propioniciclava sp.]
MVGDPGVGGVEVGGGAAGVLGAGEIVSSPVDVGIGWALGDWGDGEVEVDVGADVVGTETSSRVGACGTGSWRP